MLRRVPQDLAGVIVPRVCKQLANRDIELSEDILKDEMRKDCEKNVPSSWLGFDPYLGQWLDDIKLDGRSSEKLCFRMRPR